MYFTETYYSTNRRRPHKFRTNPRPRRPLFRDYSRPGYPYSDDSEDCKSLFSEFSDSHLSYPSEDPIRRPGDWISNSPRRVMNSVRPRKCLPSLLIADFLDLFNGRSKVTRRTRVRRNPPGYRFRAFVVDPPDDSSAEELSQQGSFVRRRPSFRGTDFPSTFEPRGQHPPRIGRPRVPGYQQPQVVRPSRERTPVTERIPARTGRRVSPVRSAGIREPMPRRVYHYRVTPEADRGGSGTFRLDSMPRTTRRSSAMPRSPAVFFREEYPSYGIPIPARENFSYSERVPESPRLIRRSPRPYQERRPRGPTHGIRLEERYPRRYVRVEERWPRSEPRITDLGRVRSSAAGARILERSRARYGGEDVMLETRVPGYW